MTVRVEHGDSRDVLKTLADASIESCVTDPPYSLVSIQKRFGKPGSAEAQQGRDGLYRRASAGFMGKQWDTGETAFDPAFWAEVYRVLKPGAHLVAFSGTRTYHRMACAIEDAGFEIRDQIGWLYGSGFPKSHNVQQGMNKAARGAPQGAADPLSPNHGKFKGGCSDNNESGRGFGAGAGAFMKEQGGARGDDEGPWQGWGTALKPAWEPICLARKPLIGTVAANVLEHGTGALNIDGCRVEGEAKPFGRGTEGIGGYRLHNRDVSEWKPDVDGRWPANVIHDGSEEVLAAFPETPGQQRGVGPQHGEKASVNVYGDYGARDQFDPRGDSGSAARFFYSAKAGGEDRLGSKHPTVKPIDLIAYLCRLITPPGGTVLDPFAGSGTCGAACLREGFDCILIEREAEYIPDIMARIELASADGRHPQAIKHRNVDPAKARGEDLPMFAQDGDAA